jgi:predicted esterase
MPPLKKILTRILAGLLRIAAGVPIVSVVLCGLLYLALGTTLRAISVGLSAVILGGVLFCSIGYWNRNWFRRIRRRFYALLVPLGLLLYLVPMIFAPGGGSPDGRVRNCLLRGQGTFPRYSPWNVIPESDQLRVGLCLLPLAERSVSAAEAAHVRSLVLPTYDEMDRDADFRPLGSVMGTAYRDLFHLGRRTGHYYLVLPEATGGRRVPCLVFLHGLGGNVKPCLWVLSKLSRQSNCAVVAPTFGFGNWDKAEGADLVVNVVHEALATLPLDPKRVYLMGYSNGAMGVTRAAMKEPGLFRGFIYLSPVTEDELFSTKQFLTAARGRRILFLHGGREERIPLAFVEGTVALLRRLGCNVRLKVYGGEDHWLLFSRQDAVLDDIREFIAADTR